MNHLKTGTAYFAQGSYKSYKYNGKELQETGMYSYGWREYMPDIGRWNGIDQLAENYLSASPYAYVVNNPISFFDPDGRVTMAAITAAMWDQTPDGSNSYWYNSGNGGFTSYDGGDKGGHAGGGSLAYGSTVSYSGIFTMGDGVYTLPPLVLSVLTSYQGNPALTGLSLSMGIQQHLATYLGYKQESYVYRGPENGQGGGLENINIMSVPYMLVEAGIMEGLMQVGVDSEDAHSSAKIATFFFAMRAPQGVSGEIGAVNKTGAFTTKSISLWSSTKTLSSIKNAYGHWTKHKAEFPELSNAKQYVEATKKFLHNTPMGTLIKTRANGEVLKYDPTTNTFGVMTAAGVPKTMFRPSGGMQYWLKQ